MSLGCHKNSLWLIWVGAGYTLHPPRVSHQLNLCFQWNIPWLKKKNNQSYQKHRHSTHGWLRDWDTVQGWELIVCVVFLRLQGWRCPCWWSCCWRFSTRCSKCGGCGWGVAQSWLILSGGTALLHPSAVTAPPHWNTVPPNPHWPPWSHTFPL